MKTSQNDQGFTLIELLTTMAIVSILTAIALPRFISYKDRAFNTQSLTDLRTAVRAQETIYSETENYVACVDLDCNTALPDFALTEGVQIQIATLNDNQQYTITVSHLAGNRSYHYDSITSHISEL